MARRDNSSTFPTSEKYNYAWFSLRSYHYLLVINRFQTIIGPKTGLAL